MAISIRIHICKAYIHDMKPLGSLPFAKRSKYYIGKILFWWQFRYIPLRYIDIKMVQELTIISDILIMLFKRYTRIYDICTLFLWGRMWIGGYVSGLFIHIKYCVYILLTRICLVFFLVWVLFLMLLGKLILWI